MSSVLSHSLFSGTRGQHAAGCLHNLCYWLRVFRFGRLEESIEKANLQKGNVNQGDLEIFCPLNLDFVVEPTCGIGAQMRPS
jgi:hypothetical protein